MELRLVIGVVLVVGGAMAQAPPLVLIGVVAILIEGVGAVWSRYGLDGVEYARSLLQDRVTCGEELALDITIWNRKNLPLAWVEASDRASDGIVVRERGLVGGPAEGESLRNAWTLAPYEKVVRHFHVVGQRRGVYSLGPVRLRVGDLFARVASETTIGSRTRFLVRPRTVPVRAELHEMRWGGGLRARFGLLEDPALFAGVREYQPGDPLRRLHWKSTARLGRPVSKRFEPAREREVVVVVDIQTATGASWQVTYVEELVEGLCVAAGSLVRQLAREGVSVGLAAAGYSGSPRQVATVLPAENPGQLARCLDLLAQLSSFPSAPFDRLVGGLLPSLRPGTTLLVLGAREPLPYLRTLRRVARSGFRVRYLAFGPGGPVFARTARKAGIAADAISLDGPWRTSTELRIGAGAVR